MFTTPNEISELLQFSQGVSKYPPTDVSYSKKSKVVFIEVALAGFSKDDIDIRLEGNDLIISSDGIESDSENSFIQQNIARRSFKRIIRLDNSYVGGEVRASMEDGLLTVNIKPTEKAINRIEIQ